MDDESGAASTPLQQYDMKFTGKMKELREKSIPHASWIVRNPRRNRQIWVTKCVIAAHGRHKEIRIWPGKCQFEYITNVKTNSLRIWMYVQHKYEKSTTTIITHTHTNNTIIRAMDWTKQNTIGQTRHNVKHMWIVKTF